MPVTAALGRVCAEDISAPIALPGFDNSAMDGYAVRAADVATAADAPVYLPVTEDIPAGRTDRLTLAPGTAHRIMTGAPLPEGADAIVPVEATDAGSAASGSFNTDAGSAASGSFGTDGRTDIVTINAASSAGRHIRRAGSDIAAGELALRAGTVIRAAQVGLLCALGIAEVEVLRPLRVAVLSTGSELVAPGHPLQYGQIYESNGEMLAAATTEAGAHAQHLHFVADDPPTFLARLDEIADDVDLILTSGGVSAGAFEVVKEALTKSGPDHSHTVDFVKVAMQPGKPQGCGHLGAPSGRRVPIVTFPGNPVSALVSFEVFLRPALRAAMGLTAHRPRSTARLDADISSPAGKRQFLRGVLRPEDKAGAATVSPIGPPASHHLRYLSGANALIDIPTDTESVAAGSIVEVIELD